MAFGMFLCLFEGTNAAYLPLRYAILQEIQVVEADLADLVDEEGEEDEEASVVRREAVEVEDVVRLFMTFLRGSSSDVTSRWSPRERRRFQTRRRPRTRRRTRRRKR